MNNIKTNNFENKIKTIDLIGLTAIGVFCVLYSMFWSSFSELNIKLPFLDFPIFVGEILFGICIVLLLLRWKVSKIRFNYLHYLVFIYVLWLLAKAFWGYFTYGPLSFRNAALFYYPLFALMGYYFYRDDYFKQKRIMLLLFVIILSRIITGGDTFNSYVFFPYFIIFLILARKVEIRWVRYSAYIILIFLFPINIFFYGSRSSILGTFISEIFLLSALFFGILRIKKQHKIMLVSIILFATTLVLIFSSQKEQISSLIAPRQLFAEFRRRDKIIQKYKRYYRPQNLNVMLYNPDRVNLLDDTLVRLGIKDKFVYEVPGTDKKITRENIENVVESEINEKIQKRLSAIRDDINSPAIPEFSDKAEIAEALLSNFRVDTEVILKICKIRLLDILNEILESKENISLFEILKNKIGVITEQGIIDFKQEKNNIIRKAKEALNNKKMLKSDYDILRKKLGYVFEHGIINIKEQGLLASERAKRMRMASVISDDNLRVEHSNTLFRLFIWRDMIHDILTEKAWLGFNFGKPQRSASLEIMTQAKGEWSRDGWIAPHNSFLHMIYRAGIVGLLMVLSIFTSLIMLTREFLRKKSITGLLLISMFVYWITIANFLVVLELPHWAIPFWCLFGMTASYCLSLRKSATKTIL